MAMEIIGDIRMKKKLTQQKHYHGHRQKIIDPEGDSAIMAASEYQYRSILTIQEVADLLRVHRSTISRYAKSGELRSYLFGNRRLFKEDDVWSFFNNQEARN